MRHLALSVVGRDRPGIVAAVSERLLAHEVNVEDSQMAILRGHFTMMLIVAAPDEVGLDDLRDELEETGERLGLEAVSLSEVAEISDHPEPSHVVTVYGADHLGILHSVASALASRQVSITDLTTRLLGEDEGRPLYVMVMEVAVPPAETGEELDDLLQAVGQAQGVEVTTRPLERDAL